MQENKRYEWDKMERLEWIRDTEKVNQPLYYDLKTVANLLNQQDKYVKDLEARTEKLENTKVIEIVEAIKGYEQQIWQLKQSQKKLAIEELEKVKEKFGYKHNTQLVVSSRYLCDFIDNQIKELKGE